MKIDCQDRGRILREQEPAALEALARHAEGCPTCASELRVWNEISAAARLLHRRWESPELWPRIRQALAEQAQEMAHEPQTWSLGQWLGREWRAVAAAAALAVLTASGTWILLRPSLPTPGVTQEDRERFVTQQAVRQVEAAEEAYVKSIENLQKLAQPRLDNATSPLMVSYREKLMMIDAAIAECRANIERNRWNARLRQELLSMYQEKQRTLQEVLREE